MLNFIIGVVVGGIVGMFICAILSINNLEKDRYPPQPVGKEKEDSDAGK
jgi:hypothetical protein